MLVYNSSETKISIYSCIFYFVDNGIAGIEGSSEHIFLFSHWQHVVGAYQNVRAYQILRTNQIFRKPIYNNSCLLCYLVRKTVFDLEKQHICIGISLLIEGEGRKYPTWLQGGYVNEHNVRTNIFLAISLLIIILCAYRSEMWNHFILVTNLPMKWSYSLLVHLLVA